jgi:hypothetical protein
MSPKSVPPSSEKEMGKINEVKQVALFFSPDLLQMFRPRPSVPAGTVSRQEDEGGDLPIARRSADHRDQITLTVVPTPTRS